jgi:hypothetical protein
LGLRRSLGRLRGYFSIIRYGGCEIWSLALMSLFTISWSELHLESLLKLYDELLKLIQSIEDLYSSASVIVRRLYQPKVFSVKHILIQGVFRCILGFGAVCEVKALYGLINISEPSRFMIYFKLLKKRKVLNKLIEIGMHSLRIKVYCEGHRMKFKDVSLLSLAKFCKILAEVILLCKLLMKLKVINHLLLSVPCEVVKPDSF